MINLFKFVKEVDRKVDLMALLIVSKIMDGRKVEPAPATNVAQPVYKSTGVKYVNVAGVTFDNRQDIIGALQGNEPVEFKIEHMDGYPNCIGVYIGARKVGNVPEWNRERTSQVAKFLRNLLKSGAIIKPVCYKIAGYPRKGVRVYFEVFQKVA